MFSRIGLCVGLKIFCFFFQANGIVGFDGLGLGFGAFPLQLFRVWRSSCAVCWCFWIFGVLGNLRSWRFGKEDSLFSRLLSVRDFLFFFFLVDLLRDFELLVCCGVRCSWFLLCTIERERELGFSELKREGGGQKRGSHVLPHLFGAEHAAAPTTLRAASP